MSKEEEFELETKLNGVTHGSAGDGMSRWLPNYDTDNNRWRDEPRLRSDNISPLSPNASTGLMNAQQLHEHFIQQNSQPFHAWRLSNGEIVPPSNLVLDEHGQFQIQEGVPHENEPRMVVLVETEEEAATARTRRTRRTRRTKTRTGI